MKNKLRKIRVNEQNYLWSIIGDKDAVESDYLLLRIWKEGNKGRPWIVVRYRFHNPWLFYGELVNIKTSEEAAKAEAFFQFEPLTPGKVAEIIKQAIALSEEKILETRFFHLDEDRKLKSH